MNESLLTRNTSKESSQGPPITSIRKALSEISGNGGKPEGRTSSKLADKNDVTKTKRPFSATFGSAIQPDVDDKAPKKARSVAGERDITASTPPLVSRSEQAPVCLCRRYRRSWLLTPAIIPRMRRHSQQFKASRDSTRTRPSRRKFSFLRLSRSCERSIRARRCL